MYICTINKNIMYTEIAHYKGQELKVSASMEDFDETPIFEEFEFTLPNDKLFRELNEKTDEELDAIFSDINWNQKHYEYIQESKEFNSHFNNY